MLTINKKLLRYRLKEKDITIKDLAADIGISQQGLNKRIHNDNLKITDIIIIMDKLQLPFEKIFIN
jgi:transcriptional regulator with XRE-family HTH domain